MPIVNSLVECPVYDSFRVAQIGGMFDVVVADKCREEFSVEVPGMDEDWQIGVIVGPSGSGKSTIARHAFGDLLYQGADWPADKAVVDCFGELPIKEITHALTTVGFSSPPSWVKPYHVLSNGERFRCDLARAFLVDTPLVVFDEFTSVVDRTVAKIGSAAVSKTIRSGKIKRRFVAVTCHYDVVEWLEPDWVVNMAGRTLARGRLQRPEIKIRIFRAPYDAWRLFARHHYLSGNLARSAHCYVATIDGQPAAFCAVMHNAGHKNVKRISRIVTLPDYQGVGIGAALLREVAQLYRAARNRVTITTSHPGMIHHLSRANEWRIRHVYKNGTNRNENRRGQVGDGVNTHARRGHTIVSAEFVGKSSGTSTANNPNLPDTGSGSICRTFVSTQAKSDSRPSKQAAASSCPTTNGRQSTTSTIATATPVGSVP